jgi:SAM-dependent methyltransferase
MDESDSERAERLYADIYDVTVADWPGELDFYGALADEVASAGLCVIEVACGTGRVAIPLAQRGVKVVGLDSSPTMLNIARQKGADVANLAWFQVDMKSFDVDQTFGLAIIPGHSFQYLLTPQAQVECLACIRRHLAPLGRLVVHLDHQDVAWLAEVAGPKKGVFEPGGEVRHPKTGDVVRPHRAWAYEPSTQTATSRTAWEIVGEDGRIADRLERAPVRLHCVFRFEMEHLLALTDYQIQGVYGDFLRHPLTDASKDMIWVASRPIDA